MNVSIIYSAPDIDSLCLAIERVRAMGILPSVSTSAPSRSPLPSDAPEPNVALYQAGRRAHGMPEKNFRLCKAEKGMSRDAAAAARMQVAGWESGSVGSVGEELTLDETPEEEPHDGTPVF